MKVRVDPDACTGCSLCTETCPEVFELGDDEVAKAKMTEVPSELEESVKDAAEDCPDEAIKIED